MFVPQSCLNDRTDFDEVWFTDRLRPVLCQPYSTFYSGIMRANDMCCQYIGNYVKKNMILCDKFETICDEVQKMCYV